MASTAVAVIDIDLTTSAPAAENDALFKTSFLRDGSSGKSFAIVQASESVKLLSYTVYERNAEAFSSRSFSGQVEADAPVFSFTITKGSKYWVIANINGEAGAVTFEVDPNKRRLGVGAGKKRAAAPETAAPEADKAAPAASAEPEKAAAAPADKPKSKKVKA